MLFIFLKTATKTPWFCRLGSFCRPSGVLGSKHLSLTRGTLAVLLEHHQAQGGGTGVRPSCYGVAVQVQAR